MAKNHSPPRALTYHKALRVQIDAIRIGFLLCSWPSKDEHAVRLDKQIKLVAIIQMGRRRKEARREERQDIQRYEGTSDGDQPSETQMKGKRNTEQKEKRDDNSLQSED